MSENMIVCAIVVTYRRRQMLQRVLKSLFMQTYSLAKIIIIDNNSQDGTQELVSDIVASLDQSIDVKYYNTGSNLGGAGGFEYGFRKMKSVKYDFLWLMDDDLSPEPDCLKHLISASFKAGIVQPMRLNIDGSCAELSPVEYDLKTPWLINPKRLSVVDYVAGKSVNETFEIAGIPFEGPLISRSVVEAVGYPNPDFFIFNDDLDYAIRARKSGFKIICHPNAIATRLLNNNQNNDLKSWKGYFMLRNHFYILKTYGQNRLVRFRPYLIVCVFFVLNILRGQFNLAKVSLRALKDSKNLSNNCLNKP